MRRWPADRVRRVDLTVPQGGLTLGFMLNTKGWVDTLGKGDELIRFGHSVALFGSGNGVTYEISEGLDGQKPFPPVPRRCREIPSEIAGLMAGYLKNEPGIGPLDEETDVNPAVAAYLRLLVPERFR